MMRKLRSLVLRLLALAVLADAFALGREKTVDLTESSDTAQDLTPAGSAAQHITKIPRSKAKVQNKTTEKPIETTTVEDDDDKPKEPAEGMHEIEDKDSKSIESTTEVHGPGNDGARTAVASNGTDDETQTANGTEPAIETTPASVTNNEREGSKEVNVPNWVPNAVSEINSDNNIDNSTVSLTSLDSETHYSTASVNDNEHKSAIVSDRLEEMPQERRQLASVNVTETDNSVNALVAEFTKANGMSQEATDEPSMPYVGPISKDESIHEAITHDSELRLTNHKTIQEEATLQPELSTYTSSDNSNKSRLTDWLRRADGELTAESQASSDAKYDKVISKMERASDLSTTNYGDKLETTSHEPVELKSPSDMKENEGPLDDVTMDTSYTWRREDSAVVTSMRGGYLNHSPDAKKDAPTRRAVVKPDDENETAPIKNRTIASHGLMVDDQIKEELLMEDKLTERISDGEERPLSVKPIGKNNSLYTVSPNYKPMKKLDVVPGKQPMRDPDDNSWRNQSLNNLGIVFKGNNSSKPFTQVLKNKTETDLSNFVEKDEITEAPELRERLEKLAEERKSKKKKTDRSGENTDDEASSYFYRTTTNGPAPRGSDQKASPFKNTFKTFDYESTDDDIEYVTLPFLDLQKSPTTKSPTRGTSRSPTTNWARPTTQQGTVRKATVQYFPPKVYMKNGTGEDDFQRKMQAFAPELDAPVSTPNLVLRERERERTTAAERTKFYLPDTPKLVLTAPYNVPADKAYSFRDIMTKIAHEDDYDRVNEYVPLHKVKEALTHDPASIRTEVIEKFMQNYNDNSKKFRVDYPVVYNSRVFHTDGRDEFLASSSASMKQQYGGSGKQLLERRNFDANCEKVVELSADYDLPYYMPDQEELEFGKVIK